MAELEKAVKATKKKASEKTAKAPPPAAPPQAKSEPKPEPVKWPRLVKCKDPSGDVKRLKVFPGVDGPLGVDDGKVVVVSGGWELLD